MNDTRNKYSYYIEQRTLEVTDRPRKFLQAFAAVLEHSSYGLALDTYTRLSTKCSRCAASCQLYQQSGEDRDIPCHRSEKLLKIYRRYFTSSGVFKARFTGGFTLTEEYLDEMAEEYYRCTACRRCKATCPMGIDHGLVTHLARWLLAEVGSALQEADESRVSKILDGPSGPDDGGVPEIRELLRSRHQKEARELGAELLEVIWRSTAAAPIRNRLLKLGK